VELSQAKEEFARQGLNAAAVSYDAAEILKKFAKTRSIAIPLLSDPKCEMIKSFNAQMPLGGYAYPGYYIINAEGVVTYSLFFEDENEVGARSTPLAVLGRIFPSTLNRAARAVAGQRLKLELSQSDEEARWRNRITLRVGIELPAGFHAYAPEVTGGYRPLKLEIATTEQYWSLPPVIYPKARVVDFPKLGEKLPVYEGKLQVTTEIAVKWAEFERLKKERRPHEIEVRGVLHYQICDSSVCFPPTSTPVSWKIRVMPYDDEMVSEKRAPQ
jgi:hypothetical protein